MISKEQLRRRTQEAESRLEQARIREDERLRHEAECRELEIKRHRQIKAIQLRQARLAKRMLANIFRETVLAANRGDMDISVPLPPFASHQVESKLLEAGFSFVKSQSCGVEAHIEVQVRRFFAMIDRSPSTSIYLQRILRVLDPSLRVSKQPGKWIAEEVEDILMDLEIEEPEAINQRAKGYLDESLYPMLNDLPQVEPTEVLFVNWRPADLIEEVLKLQGQIPSWMCSTSGSWLMQRVGECASKAADDGLYEAIFEFVPVSTDRKEWGSNSMCKFVHLGQPVGVTPFNLPHMRAMFGALGFNAECISANGRDALRLSW